MGTAQKLRHDVRMMVVGYARRHPQDFDAHMTAAAVIWLLGGRQGLSPGQQVTLVSNAHVAITSLAAQRPDSATLAAAVERSQALLDAATARLAVNTENAEVLAAAAPDFEAWAAEFASQPEA
jgi:hypothetical protein